jgi:hypothetical protein
MRFFLDTEFIESGPYKPVQLISIGIVSEDGREFYAQSSEFDANDASDWVRENVLRQLDPRSEYLSLKEIARKVYEFVMPEWKAIAPRPEEVFDKPEFWGYYADYDWVVFCQIFGTMMDLPKGFPMYCRDIKQLCDERGNPALPEQGKGEHNALADARWNKMTYDFLIVYSSF